MEGRMLWGILLQGGLGPAVALSMALLPRGAAFFFSFRFANRLRIESHKCEAQSGKDDSIFT
jgi:hypothetical protein